MFRVGFALYGLDRAPQGYSPPQGLELGKNTFPLLKTNKEIGCSAWQAKHQKHCLLGLIDILGNFVLEVIVGNTKSKKLSLKNL